MNKAKRKDMENFLEAEPQARERGNKHRTIANLILRWYPTVDIDKGMLTDMVGEILSTDRMWRKVLEEREELRGKDYDQGKRLADEKKMELGYTPGYHNDLKELDKLK